ncbi:Uncharacterised protein [Mycobacteroides abscessus subsp. massiliense]|nr:Uncharacterised protein [Mycobacteroides abscessus subsp. massiliense]
MSPMPNIVFKKLPACATAGCAPANTVEHGLMALALASRASASAET